MSSPEADALDLEPEEDDLMDEDGALDVDASPQASPPKLKSYITGESASRKTKGRGFKNEADAGRNSHLSGPDFDSLNSDDGRGALRSIDGWIIVVTGVHEEAQEDDLQNVFGEFGHIKDLHLNLDRRTGFVKGYALIQYENFEEAQAAIERMNGKELLTKTINVDWAFSNGPINKRSNNTKRREERRRRSRSPIRRY